jgi:hypothetical protein
MKSLMTEIRAGHKEMMANVKAIKEEIGPH